MRFRALRPKRQVNASPAPRWRYPIMALGIHPDRNWCGNGRDRTAAHRRNVLPRRTSRAIFRTTYGRGCAGGRGRRARVSPASSHHAWQGETGTDQGGDGSTPNTKSPFRRSWIAFSDVYRRQVQLLVRTLPLVAEEDCFALKGGTAINLFYRNLPRLSVDIDLKYMPVAGRPESLAGIDAALQRIGDRIRARYSRLPVTRVWAAAPSAPRHAVSVERRGYVQQFGVFWEQQRPRKPYPLPTS